jgi:predicted transposase YbfD/YdcC
MKKIAKGLGRRQGSKDQKSTGIAADLPKLKIAEYFEKVPDFRVDRTKRHLLIDILIITICAVISGAEDWKEIALYGRKKKDWLKSFLELPNGIPSHYTFRRVFLYLDPEKLQQCFLEWVAALSEASSGQIIAIDGKCLRGSVDKTGRKAAIHMVSAFASVNHLIMGQVKVEDKSNEITAIPQLLELINIQDCVVTIDAMGCQKEIAQKIVEQGGDYILALKGNQGILQEEVELYFQDALQQKFKGIPHDFEQTVEKDHGRVETRRCWTVSDVDWLENKNQWRGLRSLVMVESERWQEDNSTREQRLYISSLPSNARYLNAGVRSHWGIENRVHWLLDVSFREDACKVRKGNAPQNLAVIRHIALNLLRKEKTAGAGIKAKRRAAGWDNDYLLQVLVGGGS